MTSSLCVSPEVSCLQAVAVALYNPEAFRVMGQVRLDVGRVLPEHMTDEAYRELLVRSSSSHLIRLYTLLQANAHMPPTHICAQQPQTDDSCVASSAVRGNSGVS